MATVKPSGLTLDSGALIAAEKDSTKLSAVVKIAVGRRAAMTVPAPVLARVWRKNNPKIALLLKACRVVPLDEEGAREVGNLLADAGTRDIADAAVVIGALERGDAVVTSDPEDIARLAAARGTTVTIIPV